jgi:hypothetical protein
MKAIYALILAVCFSGLTYFIPSPYQPSSVTEYRGFPIPWASWETTYTWIPIIGPIFSFLTFSVDPVAFGLDAVFWFAITYLILKVAWKDKHEV